MRRGGKLLGPAVAVLLLGVGAVAHAEVVQGGNARVRFGGELTPRTLPRRAPTSVEVSVKAEISTPGGGIPEQLRKVSLSINHFGRLDAVGMPACPLRRLRATTSAEAIAACRDSLVGEGSFAATVLLSEQAPFPSSGKVYAFNGRYEGRPAILAHVYGSKPTPTTFLLPFLISRSKGTFGTTFSATMPRFAADAGYVTGLSLSLGRSYAVGRERRSYLSASCPAPHGFSTVSFPLAKGNFEFASGRSVRSTVTRSCRARG